MYGGVLVGRPDDALRSPQRECHIREVGRLQVAELFWRDLKVGPHCPRAGAAGPRLPRQRAPQLDQPLETHHRAHTDPRPHPARPAMVSARRPHRRTRPAPPRTPRSRYRRHNRGARRSFRDELTPAAATAAICGTTANSKPGCAPSWTQTTALSPGLAAGHAFAQTCVAATTTASLMTASSTAYASASTSPRSRSDRSLLSLHSVNVSLPDQRNSLLSPSRVGSSHVLQGE
jgi:hypothetical protein